MACRLRAIASSLMKIVDVADFYAPRGGGVKTYIHQKLRAAHRAGHRLVVVAPGPTDRTEALEGGVVRWVKSPVLLPDPRYHLLASAKAVHRVLDEELPDVLEGSSPWTGGWFAATWQPKRSKPCLRAFVFHQNPVAVYPATLLVPPLSLAQVNRWCAPAWSALRGLARRYHLTVTASHWLANELRGQGISNARAVPFGIDRAFFSPRRRSEVRRQQMLAACGLASAAADPSAPRPFLWIAVSRFHPEKRLGAVLKAFARVQQDAAKGAAMGITDGNSRPSGLVVFGDGPTAKWVRARARSIPHLHLAGRVGPDELATAMASADGLVHGSIAETYGLVLAEALCSGLPIVVPNAGGAFDFASHPSATVYRAGSVGDCASAMAQQMRRCAQHQASSVAEQCGRSASAHVRSPEEHFADLFSCYAAELDRISRPPPKNEPALVREVSP